MGGGVTCPVGSSTANVLHSVPSWQNATTEQASEHEREHTASSAAASYPLEKSGGRWDQAVIALGEHTLEVAKWEGGMGGGG